MNKTWGDIFNRHLRRGEDHSFAAYKADELERHKQREQQKSEQQPVLLVKKSEVSR